METTMNKQLNISIDIDAFVVPNSASKLDLNWSFGIHRAEEIERIAELNNFSFDRENDELVQLWFVGKEFCHSENLQDHGFSFEYEGKDYHFGSGTVPSYLPPVVFKDHKEGDVVSITYPLMPDFYYDATREEIHRLSRSERRD